MNTYIIITMSKLLILGTVTIGSVYVYRKATEFETNITINEKMTKRCLFDNLDRHCIESDKGLFTVAKRDCISNPFIELDTFDKLYKYQTYHVTGYGLNYPKLHLYRKIVKQIGTPCDIQDHCSEKESLVNKVISKF